MPTKPLRVALFGIDGATFDLLVPWAEQGLLPNLASLLARGAHGPLRSTLPPITPCAWTTMMTGTNPGRHGVFDFTLPRAGTYGRRLTTAADRKTPTVWQLLSAAGLAVGVVNVPTTYPPDEVNGYMMSGMMGAPSYRPEVVYPRSLFGELQEAIGGFPMDVVNKTSRGYSLSALDAQTANRQAAFTYLLDAHPTDVFIGVVNYVDHLEHFFIGDAALDSEGRRVEDVLLYGYQAADRLLGEILGRCGPETYVLVTSDHGAGPLQGYLNMDRLLVDCGLLRFKSKQSDSGEGGALRKLARMTPDWLRAALPKTMKRRALEMVRREYEGEVDWLHTMVFRRTSGFGLDLNLQGREPEGTIPASEYERAREEIIDVLAEALKEYPQVGPVQFYRREEIYQGAQTPLAADIIVAPAEYAVEITPSPSPQAGVALSLEDMARFDAPKRYKIGSHRMDGVFIAAGPGIQAGAIIEGAQIADVTPTLLKLAGVEAPEGLDGRLLDGI